MASTAPKVIRVACIDCHGSKLTDERGTFVDAFREWLETAAEARNKKVPSSEHVIAHVQGWDVVNNQEYPDLTDIDALIISGSVASSYDDEPWIHRLTEFLQDVYKSHPKVRIYGGCFGHQIVSQALLGAYGVRVEKNPRGWIGGVHEVAVTNQFSSQFPQLLKDGKLSYQFLHQDHVVTNGATLPPNWIELGATPLCESQGFLDPGRVLTYQGHPEFDSLITGTCVTAIAKKGIIPEESVKQMLGLVEQHDSAVLAGEIALEFFSKPQEKLDVNRSTGIGGRIRKLLKWLDRLRSKTAAGSGAGKHRVRST